MPLALLKRGFLRECAESCPLAVRPVLVVRFEEVFFQQWYRDWLHRYCLFLNLFLTKGRRFTELLFRGSCCCLRFSLLFCSNFLFASVFVFCTLTGGYKIQPKHRFSSQPIGLQRFCFVSCFFAFHKVFFKKYTILSCLKFCQKNTMLQVFSAAHSGKMVR